MRGRAAALALACLAAMAAAPAHGSAAQVQIPDTLDGEPYGTLEAPGLVVRHAPRDSLVAERVLEFLRTQTPLPGLAPGVPGGVTAVLAHSPAAFDALTGGAVPEWRAGVALPAAALLVVPTGEGRRVLDPEGLRVLRHEWAHLGLHQAVQSRVPRWFDEGYAQWASGGWDASEAWRLRVLLALGRSPPLDSLTLSWPRERASAEVAYLLAASAVTYLLRESGERGLALFLARWGEERSFEAALRGTFGVTSGQLEEDWRKHVRSEYGWLFVLSHSAVFWAALAVALALMWRVRARLNRERLARLRADEIAERPDFWNPPTEGGDPPASAG